MLGFSQQKIPVFRRKSKERYRGHNYTQKNNYCILHFIFCFIKDSIQYHCYLFFLILYFHIFTFDFVDFSTFEILYIQSQITLFLLKMIVDIIQRGSVISQN